MKNIIYSATTTEGTFHIAFLALLYPTIPTHLHAPSLVHISSCSFPFVHPTFAFACPPGHMLFMFFGHAKGLSYA